jgi:predicted PurR-regulated permease PerM
MINVAAANAVSLSSRMGGATGHWWAYSYYQFYIPSTLIIISVVSLLTFDAWSHIIWPPLAFLFLTVWEGQFVMPSLLGRRLMLNPLMVLLSILFWGWIWGIGGAVLGVPLLTAFMVAAKNIKSLQPVEKFLA